MRVKVIVSIEHVIILVLVVYSAAAPISSDSLIIHDLQFNQLTGQMCIKDSDCSINIHQTCNENTSQCECIANYVYNATNQLCVDCRAGDSCAQMPYEKYR